MSIPATESGRTDACSRRHPGGPTVRRTTGADGRVDLAVRVRANNERGIPLERGTAFQFEVPRMSPVRMSWVQGCSEIKRGSSRSTP